MSIVISIFVLSLPNIFDFIFCRWSPGVVRLPRSRGIPAHAPAGCGRDGVQDRFLLFPDVSGQALLRQGFGVAQRLFLSISRLFQAILTLLGKNCVSKMVFLVNFRGVRVSEVALGKVSSHRLIYFLHG